VLECFDIPELLEMRYVNRKLGDDLIPKCFKLLKYNCPDDEDEDEEYTFYKIIKNAKKVEIGNISGNEAHLRKIEEIADNVGKHVRYLYLNFDGDTDSTELAQRYVEVFKKFDSLDTLRFEVYEDGNLTKILEEMMKDQNFIWFEKVRTIKCYLVRDMKSKEVL
jgi:oligoendopeptidase F